MGSATNSEPNLFHAALLHVPPTERDAWLDSAFGLGELPSDSKELPRGCVPYLPSSVDTLLRVVEHTPVRSTDVFVDIGSGVGRAAALVHLLSGAAVVGLEIQADLVIAARNLVSRLEIPRVTFIESDASKPTEAINVGSVFFLYCPFSGDRLVKLLAGLELIARNRRIHVCTVDLPLPSCHWLTLQEAAPLGDLVIYRSK